MPPKGYKVPFKVRKNGYENYCTYEWLEEHYIKQRLSTQACADLIGASSSTIKRWLKIHGIPARSRKDYGYEKFIAWNETRKIIIPKDWLIEHYVNKRLSCRECAELYGCSESQIKDLLKEYGIKRRPCTWKAHEVVRLKIREGTFVLQKWDRGGDNNPAKRPEVREKIRQSKLGSNNPMWNPNLTDEERERSRSYDKYVKWRLSVFIRDNFTCQCCGAKTRKGKRIKLAAHHLFSHCDNKELRLNLDNGVTLCWNCHGEFHRIYGKKGNNTPEQFTEFMKSKGKDFKYKGIQLSMLDRAFGSPRPQYRWEV